MTQSRRHFLRNSAVAGGSLALGLGRTQPPLVGLEGSGKRPDGRLAPGTRTSPPAPLRILILGGTSFLGPHQIRYALERGHSISTFTRGRTEPSLFPEIFDSVEKLIGDRENDLEALRGRSWDVVIDNSGARTQWTRDSAQLLKENAGAYLYVSSTGVYYPYLTTEIGEDTAVAMVDESGGENGSAAYGVMKATSEIAAREAFGDDRTLVIRPGYIVGPADRSDRFTYWPVRFHRGGEILAPGKKSDQVQMIDVRDLTEWMIRLLEVGASGVFNATGPGFPLSMEEFMYGMRATTSSVLSFTWIEDYAFLEEHNLTFAIPWLMPVGDHVGSQRIDVSRAVAHGLTYRPLAVTAMDTLDWWHSENVTDERRTSPRFVLTPEREAEILAAWKAR
ncbi:MAG: NAD-dependent epimerase/dehydratase family protein [Longimicrobiales bacterium]